MAQSRVSELFNRCDNAGLWGNDDQRGTLNYISVAQRLAALALVRVGDIVSLGKVIRTGSPGERTTGACLTMIDLSDAAKDTLSLTVHGFDITHLDAVGHNAVDGRMYNGRDARRSITAEGLKFGAIDAAGEGVLTRGVLLDVAQARDVDYLPVGTRIGPDDLEAAEDRLGVRVGRGDAVFVRSGRDRRLDACSNPDPSSDEAREGLDVDAVLWLHGREVSVYSGDCIEALPSAEPGLDMPLHQLGAAAMGLAILDNPDIEGLADACARHDRHDFALVIAPLKIQGGTGNAVNPLALF